ncbi:MAG: LytTR family DNA-binding domain-containing protein [Bacteroidia bacterium]
MSSVTAIIVDDEKFNREQLQIKLSKYYPDMIITAMCENGLEAAKAVDKFKPDLVFLDIEMPVMNGFDFLQQFKEPGFEVIFITAYDQYAIKAIKFSALDYLLKPLDTDELQVAVNRFLDKRKRGIDNKSLIENFIRNLNTEKKSEYRLALNTTEGTYFLKTEEIIRCEADSNYTKFFLNKRKNMITSKTLKEYEDMLGEHNFLRVHKSHLVNRKFIKSLSNDGFVILNDDSRVEVSRRRYSEVKEMLSSSN